MSKPQSYKSSSRLRGLWCALSGWLIVGFVLIIGLSTCAPQPEQSIPTTASISAPTPVPTAQEKEPSSVIISTAAAPVGTTAPTVASPAAPDAQRTTLAPAIVATAPAPAGTETRLGFNVRGWT